ncbi:MAG: recombinase family protein [Methylocystis sp.]
MSLIGYARVSTEDQATDVQIDALTAAGCAVIFREHMSGAKATRPELLKALAKVQRGDVLVVARLDRLARSLSHLLSGHRRVRRQGRALQVAGRSHRHHDATRAFRLAGARRCR